MRPPCPLIVAALALSIACSPQPPAQPTPQAPAPPSPEPAAALAGAEAAPGEASAPTSAALTTDAQPSQAKGCSPMEHAQPLHEPLRCLVEAMPHDRLMVIGSRASLKGFVAQAEQAGASCPTPTINFNTHTLVALHARGPCQISVQDQLCEGSPPRYEVTILGASGCTYYGTQPRAWLIAQPPERLSGLELKLTRRGASPNPSSAE